MAISLYVKDYCANCRDFEPDTHKQEYFINGEGFKHDTHIYCEHRDRCDKILEFLHKELDIDKEKENEQT